MEEKKAVMLVFCRKIIAEALVKAIEKNRSLEVFGVYDCENAWITATSRKPALALVEIPERYGSPALETLDICDNIKKASPGCKIILLCPERDKESVSVCIDVKKRGEIEDFIFYEAGVDYLASKVESLLPA